MRRRPEERDRKRIAVGGVGCVFDKRLDGDFAGDLTCRMAAHAVGDGYDISGSCQFSADMIVSGNSDGFWQTAGSGQNTEGGRGFG